MPTATATDLPLHFRHAGRGDVDAVVALVESAYRGESSRAGWTTEADLLDGRRTGADEVGVLVEAAGGCVLIAESVAPAGPRVMACAHLRREGSDAWFGLFAVVPGLQGAGIGSRMLAEAEQVARSWGCTAMAMTVIAQRSELIAWYTRRGYAQTGTVRPFPYGDARFGLPRRADLCFEVLRKPL